MVIPMSTGRTIPNMIPRSASLAAAQDKTLSVEERKARLKELESQAETKIKELLGDKAAKPVVRDLRNVLRSSASFIKP